MRPKNFAIVVIIAVLCGIVAEYIARGQSSPQPGVRVRWKANTETDIAGYRVMIHATNIGAWVNPLSTNWVTDAGNTTSAPVMLPGTGPWVARVQAYNLAGLSSLWSTGVVFSLPGVVREVTITQDITISFP